MNIKEELKQYRKNVRKIEDKKEEIMEILENRSYLISGNMDATGIIAKGFKQSSLELEIIRIDTKIEKLKKEIGKIEKKLLKIDRLIVLLNNEQRKIIVDFFLFNKTNRQIANELCVEIEAVKKRKQRIIRKMQKMSENY